VTLHSASAPEAKYPGNKPPKRKASTPRRAPQIVVVNDPRKEFIGKQTGLVVVHPLSPNGGHSLKPPE
jgi:hypothetical protein